MYQGSLREETWHTNILSEPISHYLLQILGDQTLNVVQSFLRENTTKTSIFIAVKTP